MRQGRPRIRGGGPILYWLRCSNIHSPYCIQKWDGKQWGTLPNPWGPPGVVATANAIEAFDDGTGEALYLTERLVPDDRGNPGERPGAVGWPAVARGG